MVGSLSPDETDTSLVRNKEMKEFKRKWIFFFFLTVTLFRLLTSMSSTVKCVLRYQFRNHVDPFRFVRLTYSGFIISLL